MPTLVEAVLEWEKNSSLGGGNKMQRNVAADERKKLYRSTEKQRSCGPSESKLGYDILPNASATEFPRRI
jgi:hypothetical protein